MKSDWLETEASSYKWDSVAPTKAIKVLLELTDFTVTKAASCAAGASRRKEKAFSSEFQQYRADRSWAVRSMWTGRREKGQK